MPKLRLGDADRARLGCPEFMESGISSITNLEAMALQKLGYATPRTLAVALRGNEEGTDYRALTAVVWLALRRAGVDVPFDELEFNLNELDSIPDEPAEAVVVSEGKAPARAGSRNSPRTRSTSTATSKRKSASPSSTS